MDARGIGHGNGHATAAEGCDCRVVEKAALPAELSRLAADHPLRTVAELITSSAAFPVAWSIAALSVRDPGAYMVGAFALSGLLGASALAAALLVGRPRWVRGASATVALGTLTSALMGAYLLAASKGIDPLGFARDALGIFLVLWQTVVSATLARALLPQPREAHPSNGAPPSVADHTGVGVG